MIRANPGFRIFSILIAVAVSLVAPTSVQPAFAADSKWSGWTRPTATNVTCTAAKASTKLLQVAADCGVVTSVDVRATIDIQRSDVIPNFKNAATTRVKYVCWTVPGSYGYWLLSGPGGVPSVRDIYIESKIAIQGHSNLVATRGLGLEMGRRDFTKRGFKQFAFGLGDLDPLLKPFTFGSGNALISSLPGTEGFWSAKSNVNTTFCGEIYDGKSWLLGNQGVLVAPGKTLTYTITLGIYGTSAGGQVTGFLRLPDWLPSWSTPGNNNVKVEFFGQAKQLLFRD
jgi:hypothetical protein